MTTRRRAETLSAGAAAASMIALMAQINKYAANLKALVEADTAKQVEGPRQCRPRQRAESGADGCRGGRRRLPEQACRNSRRRRLGGQLGRRPLRRQREVQGPAGATAAAKPVRDAAQLFSVTSGVARELGPGRTLPRTRRAPPRAFDGDKSKASLAAFVQTAATYDAFLTAGPQQMFQGWRPRTMRWRTACRTEELSFVAAVARIETFAAEAKKLAKIVKDLRAVVPAKPGG